MLGLVVCLYIYEESGDAGVHGTVSTSMRSLVMLGLMVCLYIYEVSGNAGGSWYCLFIYEEASDAEAHGQTHEECDDAWVHGLSLHL